LKRAGLCKQSPIISKSAPREVLGIADNLSKAGWSWDWVSAVDVRGRMIFMADAHRDDGKRFVVRADEKLTAFVEPETAIRCATAL
jgi:hypothetical protein